MNIALILAGGAGSRMGEDIPKQFIEVDDRPVIVYTLLAMQNHLEIDKIQIVCIKGWEEQLREYANKFDITKLNNIVTGGKTRFESTKIGMESLGNVADEDVIIVHDAARPLVTVESLSDTIAVCKRYGNSMTVLDCVDTMYDRTTNEYTNKEVARGNLARGQTPEAVTGKRMREMYKAAEEKNIKLDSISALQIALGWRVYFAKGSERNIKLTRKEDIELFKALLIMEKDEWLK
ncbi:MAG: 2-C-methyl-D-erythritol 4-phosphate cytidylyltransferase [Selenomonadaceae bacterium]|nr:2-C-methyl-D-erythritol 4-phosphate cytidylyltransferase [Selenomonadaceae bacterium]